MTYAIQNAANVGAEEILYSASETRFTLSFDDISASDENTLLTISSSLVGEFNVYNMLAAAAAALQLGVTPGDVRRGLQSISAISGRMERIDQGQPFLLIVDFAHTPNALEKALQAARQMTAGRLITVFGSAGKTRC